MHYFPRGFYGTVRKIFKEWAKILLLLKAALQLPSLHLYCTCSGSCQDLKSGIPETLLPSSYLPCSQPGSISLQGVYFPFLKTTLWPFKKRCWIVCLPDASLLALPDTSTKPRKKTAHQAWKARAHPDCK